MWTSASGLRWPVPCAAARTAAVRSASLRPYHSASSISTSGRRVSFARGGTGDPGDAPAHARAGGKSSSSSSADFAIAVLLNRCLHGVDRAAERQTGDPAHFFFGTRAPISAHAPLVGDNISSPERPGSQIGAGRRGNPAPEGRQHPTDLARGVPGFAAHGAAGVSYNKNHPGAVIIRHRGVLVLHRLDPI